MNTFAIYEALVAAYRRTGRNTDALMLRIDTTYALGRITEAQYRTLVMALSEVEENA